MIPSLNIIFIIWIVWNWILFGSILFYTLVNRNFPIERYRYYPPDVMEMNRFDP